MSPRKIGSTVESDRPVTIMWIRILPMTGSGFLTPPDEAKEYILDHQVESMLELTSIEKRGKTFIVQEPHKR